MTLVTHGDENVIEQIVKQLNKLIDVVKLLDLSEGSHIERELMMAEGEGGEGQCAEELKRLADIFRANIIDVTSTSYTTELTGTSAKLDAFLEGGARRGHHRGGCVPVRWGSPVAPRGSGSEKLSQITANR